MAFNIYYDGDCYFCSNFVKKLELEETYGQVNLYSIRDNLAVKEKIRTLGFNVNKGFLVEYNQKWFWGDEAYKLVNINKNKKIDMRSLASKVPYKFLVLGRYITLIFQGIGLIDISQKDNENSMFVRTIRLSLLSISFTFLTLSFILLSFPFISNLSPQPIFSSFTTVICVILTLCFFYQTYLVNRKVKIAKKLKFYFQSQSYYFWFGYIFIIISILNVVPIIAITRITLFFLLLPLIAYFYDRYKSENNKKGKSGMLLSCLILFSCFPGLYIAPFFNGIAGWVVHVDPAKNFYATTYVLTNSSNKRVILNHALLEPSSMLGRLETAWINSGRSKLDFLNFSYENYKRLYPIIKSGNLPHQRILKKFAYPTHTLSDSNASLYLNFPPEDIKSISQITYEINWKGEIISEKETNILPINVR